MTPLGHYVQILLKGVDLPIPKYRRVHNNKLKEWQIADVMKKELPICRYAEKHHVSRATIRRLYQANEL